MGRAKSPLGKLHEELTAFANQPEQKLLVIETEDGLRKDVLDQVDAVDLLIPDPAIVSMFESPWMPADACWDARHEELEDEWVALADAFKRDKQPPLQPLPDAARPDIAAFAVRLQAAHKVLSPHFPNVVVALAPLAVEDAPTFAQELTALMAQPALAPLRWIVVTVGPSGLAGVVDARPKAAALVRIEADPAADAAALKGAVAAMAAAPVGAHPAQLAGGVGPSVAPPPRKKAAGAAAPAAPSSPELAAANVPSGVTNAAAMQALRVSILQAGLAAGDGDFEQAITKQRQARQTTAALQMDKETAALDLILGAYGLMAKQPQSAIKVFQDVEARAQSAGWGAVAVQAAMARAGALMMLDRRMDAAAAYAEGGRAGTKLAAPALAIESFGLGGQLLVDLGDQRRALAVWNEALLTAESAKPEDVSGSSVLEIGKKGFELCRRLGAPGEASAWAQRTEALRVSFEAADASAQEGASA